MKLLTLVNFSGESPTGGPAAASLGEWPRVSGLGLHVFAKNSHGGQRRGEEGKGREGRGEEGKGGEGDRIGGEGRGGEGRGEERRGEEGKGGERRRGKEWSLG